MKPEPIKVSATLEKVSTMKDGGLNVNFHTQEVSAKKAGEIMAIKKITGWLIFATYDNEAVLVPDEPPPEFQNQKSLTKRLYDVMFVWWKQSKTEQDFEAFRRAKMEAVIQWVKDKLEPNS